MTPQQTHPVIDRLRSDSRVRPLVASHRGASCEFPENTLPAYRRATELAVAIQEFDVRELKDGALVCVHDETWDRTTNAAELLGPGALVAETTLANARRLDAGSGHAATAETVPTLHEALEVMLPTCVPLIEHKAGRASSYVEFLQKERRTDQVILQSFDWHFLREVRALAPEIAIGALGPIDTFATPTDAAVAQALTLGAQVLHWRAAALTRADVQRAHAAGLLVCTYTTDDEPGWRAGQDLGVDAMCTNDPAGMTRALNS